MTARPSVTMLITGGILTFAVSGHPSFVDMQLAGVILMMTGAIGLWPRGGRAWLRLARARLRKTLAEIAPVHGIRVPLEDLLGAGRQRSQEPDVWEPHTGHQSASGCPQTRRR